MEEILLLLLDWISNFNIQAPFSDLVDHVSSLTDLNKEDL